MLRALTQILLSIQLSTHAVPEVREEMLARCIQQRAEYAGVDPLIIVAIISHESQWNERAISTDGMDYGLMQVRARHYGGNSNYLLSGESNINVGTDLIKKDIAYCQRILGRQPSTQEWLSVYQGSPSAYKCKPTKLTKQFEDYALCLQDNVENAAGHNCKLIYWPWMARAKVDQ